MIATAHEQRLQHAESDVSDIHARLEAHEKTDELQFRYIGDKIDALGSSVMAKMDDISADVKELKSRTETQDQAIQTLRIKERDRQQQWGRVKKLLFKLVWAIPAAAAGGFGHHMVEKWFKAL